MENTANFLDISILKNGDLELKWELKSEHGAKYLLKLNILLSELFELDLKSPTCSLDRHSLEYK